MTRHAFNLNLLSVGAFKLNWGRGTSDNCNSNGAHRSQGTPAHTAHTIQNTSSCTRPNWNWADDRQTAGEEGGGRWATVSLGVLSARLPYKGNETLSTPMLVVCDCWRRCRLCMCLATWLMLRPFRQLLMGPRTCPQRETNKQTVRQTGRETDKETQQQQTQFAIEAATIGGSNGGNIVAAAADQEWAWASGVDLCVPHEERSRVRPQSR